MANDDLVHIDACTKRERKKPFLPGMSWDNYGPVWHVDHIIPVKSFSFESAECPDFKACWALTNLRPLWKHENMVKQGRRMHLL